MRLLVADDHELIRDTLQSFLAREAGVEIVTVADLPAAYDRIAQDVPFDLVLLDYAMPGMNGLEGLARVLALPNPPKVALLSGLAARDVAEAALVMGAQGFLTKAMPARSLLSAIRFMATGERFVPVEVMLSGLPSPDPMPQPQAEGGSAVSLTPRELQVLRALCDGKTNKEIARDMGLREPTVKLHIKTLYRRLGASNRTQAAMMARRLGLV
jgi:two-component system, NarL family, nitrate/nitrite response regulator NarL